MSVNLSYSSASFTQGIKWNTTVSYTGHALYPVALGTALAVSCNAATQQYFVDLANASQPCITQAKVDLLQTRLNNEVKAKAPLYAALNLRLATGAITIDTYNTLKKAIDQMVITDNTFSLETLSTGGLSGTKFSSTTAPPGQLVYTIDPQSGKLVARKIGDKYKLVQPLETLKALQSSFSK